MWSEYLTIIGVLVIVWYLVLALFFFKDEVKELISGRLLKVDKVTVEENERKMSKDENPLAELEVLIDDILYSILVKAGKGVSKEVLFTRLKERLASYDGLHRPAYRVAINNFIVQQAKELCGVAFKEEELEEAWKELLS
jgi:hypothetical protein